MMRCEFNISGQCVHDTGKEIIACGTCPYSFEDGACRCAMFAPHEPNVKMSYIEKRASWEDVAAKGRAIVASDGVEIIRDDAQEVEAWVMSGQLEGQLNDLGRKIDITDGGPYDVILSKKSWESKSNVGGWIQGWLCDCVWGSYFSGYPDGMKWHGRFCSHAYALMLYKNMRARKQFMGASVIDRENFINDACAGFDVGDVTVRDGYEVVSDGKHVAVRLTERTGDKMDWYKWHRYAQEETEDPVEREFEALIERLKGADRQDALVDELQNVVNDPKAYALLCAGFGDGEFAENLFNTEDITIPVRNLVPTQNEIGLGNSLDFMLKGKSDVSMYFNSPVTIVAPIITFNRAFIIDGHHRWSQLYMINPDAEITAVNFSGNVAPGQVLRDMQGAIAAAHAEVPQSFADVANVYAMNDGEVYEHVMNTIVDSAVDDMYEYAELADEYGENITLDEKRRAVAEYLVYNAMTLTTDNKPYGNAPNREDMPQTDEESVDMLDEGATDI